MQDLVRRLFVGLALRSSGDCGQNWSVSIASPEGRPNRELRNI